MLRACFFFFRLSFLFSFQISQLIWCVAEKCHQFGVKIIKIDGIYSVFPNVFFFFLSLSQFQFISLHFPFTFYSLVLFHDVILQSFSKLESVSSGSNRSLVSLLSFGEAATIWRAVFLLNRITVLPNGPS